MPERKLDWLKRSIAQGGLAGLVGVASLLSAKSLNDSFADRSFASNSVRHYIDYCDDFRDRIKEMGITGTSVDCQYPVSKGDVNLLDVYLTSEVIIDPYLSQQILLEASNHQVTIYGIDYPYGLNRQVIRAAVPNLR